jgi:predicted DNA-binding transcriptional regulator YafY
VRADRLVAILLLLQQRGQVTAREIADELEISERTARRDLDALGVAGIPVYSVQGRNGGWRLAGGGRTDLSGLTAAEARALFLVAGPSSAATPQVRAALRKLVRALPEPLRAEAEAAATAVHVDPTGWDQRASDRRPSPPHLDVLQQAVVGGRQARVGYVARDGTTTSRVVDPLGIAAKGDVWYLVAGTPAGQRTFRVDRVTAVEVLPTAAARPRGFDLAAAWRSVTDDVQEARTSVRADVSVRPDALRVCRWVWGVRFAVGPTRPDGRIAAEIRGHSVDSLAGEVAGLGSLVEVHAPEGVRERLARLAAELGGLYGRLRAPALADTAPARHHAPYRPVGTFVTWELPRR